MVGIELQASCSKEQKDSEIKPVIKARAPWPMFVDPLVHSTEGLQQLLGTLFVQRPTRLEFSFPQQGIPTKFQGTCGQRLLR